MSKVAFHILNYAVPDEKRIWADVWNAWPMREVHAHPGYVGLYADGKKCHALCAFFESPGGRVLYPFVLRDISLEPYWTVNIGPAWDIVTPYGYGGPFVWGNGDFTRIADEFWPHFDAWAAQQCVVSEFVRFALFKENLLPYPSDPKEILQNVVRDLDADQNSIWMDFKHKVRKNVKRAQSNDIIIELDTTGKRFDDFFQIYNSTMDRRKADKAYYFNRSYFDAIHHDLVGNFIYFHAIHEGKVISTELILLSDQNVYSFLGGTDITSFSLRPNDLLKYEIIIWAKKHGKKRFILGGGYQPGDGIYEYKFSFAPNGSIPFFVGHRILLKDLYDKLITNRSLLAESQGIEWFPRPDYFPQYRA